MGLAPARFIELRGGTVRVTAKSRAEATIALKELKIKRKEFGLKKRAISDQQRAIRANYTDEVRNRGSMMRGGGGIGKIFRTIQTISRDGRRSRLAHELAPLETKKQEIEAVLRAIDSVIVQLEANLLGP
jgi:hypothetical protein